MVDSRTICEDDGQIKPFDNWMFAVRHIGFVFIDGFDHDPFQVCKFYI